MLGRAGQAEATRHERAAAEAITRAQGLAVRLAESERRGDAKYRRLVEP